MVSLEKPLAVELLTWIGGAGYECPSSRSNVRIGTASWPFMYSAPISDLAEEPITLDIIWEMEWMGPLRRGQVVGGLKMSGQISPEEIVFTRAAAGLRFGEVGGVAMNVEDHVTGVVPDRGVGVCGVIVEQP